jgi:hypothetical protein
MWPEISLCSGISPRFLGEKARAPHQVIAYYGLVGFRIGKLDVSERRPKILNRVEGGSGAERPMTSPAGAGTATAYTVRCSTNKKKAAVAAIALLASLAAASCADEPDNTLKGRIDGVLLGREHPSATVDQIVGGFNVYLELGPAATVSADVQPGNGSYMLVRESDQRAMAGLHVACDTTRHLDPGESASVHVTIAEQGVGQALPTATLDEICTSRWMRIDGNVADNPDGGVNTPLRSTSFELQNCP